MVKASGPSRLLGPCSCHQSALISVGTFNDTPSINLPIPSTYTANSYNKLQVADLSIAAYLKKQSLHFSARGNQLWWQQRKYVLFCPASRTGQPGMQISKVSLRRLHCCIRRIAHSLPANNIDNISDSGRYLIISHTSWQNRGIS